MCRSKLSVPVQELQLINFNVVPSDDCIKCRQMCADVCRCCWPVVPLFPQWAFVVVI